jgi:hypothetical protein
MSQQSSSTSTQTLDTQRRNAVYLQSPNVVLIKITTDREIDGVRTVRRTAKVEQQLEAKHQVASIVLGVDANRFRSDKTDTGAQLVANENYVTLNELTHALVTDGYAITDIHYFVKEGKTKKTYVINLTKGGQPVQINEELGVADLIANAAVNVVAVWANRREDGTRLDTINCIEVAAGKKPPRRLVRSGASKRTYAVVAAEQQQL